MERRVIGEVMELTCCSEERARRALEAEGWHRDLADAVRGRRRALGLEAVEREVADGVSAQGHQMRDEVLHGPLVGSRGLARAPRARETATTRATAKAG